MEVFFISSYQTFQPPDHQNQQIMLKLCKKTSFTITRFYHLTSSLCNKFTTLLASSTLHKKEILVGENSS